MLYFKHTPKFPLAPNDLSDLIQLRMFRTLKRDCEYDVLNKTQNIVTIRKVYGAARRYNQFALYFIRGQSSSFIIKFKGVLYLLRLDRGIIWWEKSDNVLVPLFALVVDPQVIWQQRFLALGSTVDKEELILLIDNKAFEPQFKKILKAITDKARELYIKGSEIVDIEETLFEQKYQNFKSITAYKKQEKQDLSLLEKAIENEDYDNLFYNYV